MTVASFLAILDLSFPKNKSLNIDPTTNNAKSIALVHFPTAAANHKLYSVSQNQTFREYATF